jgi:hypothetical protein
MVWFTNIVECHCLKTEAATTNPATRDSHRAGAATNAPVGNRLQSVFLAKSQRRTRPAELSCPATSSDQLGCRANRYKGGSQSCRRNRDLGVVHDLRPWIRPIVLINMNFVMIESIDHGYWSILYQYYINMSWYFSVANPTFPAQKQYDPVQFLRGWRGPP